MDVRQKKLPSSPELKANPISRLFLLWVLPLLRIGSKRELEVEDVYHSLPNDSSAKLGSTVEEKWNEELTRASLHNKRPKLWRVVARIIWFKYSIVGIGYTLDELVLRTIQPIALRNFIRTFNVKDGVEYPNLRRDQYIYASVLVFVTFCHSVLFQKLIGTIIHIGMRMRLGVSSLIYRKILKLRKSDSEQANVGKLCNLLSSDVGRLDQSFHLLHFFYIAPIQLTIYSYLLWEELGISSLGGIGCILFFLPMQVLVGRFFLYFRVRIAKRTDERGRFLNEIIGGIRLIKMYAWETPFAVVISQLRKLEIKYIRRSLYLRGMYVSVHTISSKLIPFCALILYVALGNTLTADKAFFSISIFNTILQAIMNRIPNAASQLGELIASLNRVEEFLLSKDNASRHATSYHFKEDAAENGIVNGKESGVDSTGISHAKYDSTVVEAKIVMRNYSASWIPEIKTLQDLNVTLKGNKLVMIVGHVGAGKSSFLNAILSELPITSADESHSDGSYCHIQGRLSYASQEAWIFPATVRQNILFGLPMNDDRYWKTIKLCCLSDDFKQFPYGDLTLVGERGVALSGGQKARVNLARAIYQNAEIYLLDDPLSAVDTKVSKSLFNDCIKGYLDGKLRILVTHQLQYMSLADHIIVLNRDGSIWGQGSYDELKASNIDFTSLISDEFMTNDAQDIDELRGKADETKGSRKRLKSQSKSEKSVGKADLTESSIHKRQEEKKEEGSVGLGMYYRYFRSGGSLLSVFILVVGFLITEILKNFTDYWLSLWTNAAVESSNFQSDSSVKNNISTPTMNNEREAGETLFGGKDQDFYAKVYCILMAAFIFTCVFRSILFFKYSMRISINLHDSMFQSLVRAPVKLFDVNPSGRVMNRFTKDLNQIDEQLPVAFYDFIAVVLALFGVLAINIAANYYLAIPSVILLIALWYLRGFYLKSARALKRIESLTKSPMFTHVSMSVQGLTTIRALKAQDRVLSQFEMIQDMHTSVWYMVFITGRWFAIWLEMLSNVFLAVVTFGFLFLTTSSQGGSVGVAISAILSLSGALQWGIRQSAETENFMTSVERAIEYTNLPPEAPLKSDHDDKLPNDWPKDGGLTFKSVSLAYDDEKEVKVLKEIDLLVNPREKVGIVGRTGAGKSSLITALFRLTELSNGSITMDGIPIESLGLHTLRSKISIIPQDPVLFTGSLRYNLDPFDEFSDDHLWSVLKEVDLHHAVQSLDCPVADGGSNFSVGQRQLVCLARAILRRNRIIVLDEATANVDPATDQLVQQTIRNKFAECTILTIAHRLQTVLDNDRILVLDDGKVAEFGTPAELSMNENGIFYSLLHQQNSSLITPG